MTTFQDIVMYKYTYMVEILNICMYVCMYVCRILLNIVFVDIRCLFYYLHSRICMHSEAFCVRLFIEERLIVGSRHSKGHLWTYAKQGRQSR